METKAFERFAPAILKIYQRNKETFWAAVTAPFLAENVSLAGWLRNLQIDAQLLAAFRGIDAHARQVLIEFGSPFGVDVTRWESNRPQYFKDAYPVFAFLAVWMDEEGLVEYLDRFDEILRAGVYAVAGYGILDANVDSDAPSAVEILTAQALIAEYETLALDVFGVTPVNLRIVHKMRTLFLGAEIKEKAARHKASPYRLDDPKDLGTKGANAVTPYMLSLERLGKAEWIDDYWEVFLLFGAAIQLIDDWTDLEKDLAAGHYSYVTLGAENLLNQEPKQAARQLRSDRQRGAAAYATGKEMVAQSRAILERLNDTMLVRLVDVTEVRLDADFKKYL